jgi:hypothetical protein
MAANICIALPHALVFLVYNKGREAPWKVSGRRFDAKPLFQT